MRGGLVTRIKWVEAGTRLFEAGVDRGVLYVGSNPGVPWIGLIGVNHASYGGEPKPRYIDGVKISNHATPEHFEGTIEAYTYPDEFRQCDGSTTFENGLRVKHQNRKSFNLAYRTRVGNDLQGVDHAYKIHILYNLRARPAEREDTTFGEDIDPMTFSWDISSRGVLLPGFRPTAYFEIDSRTTPTSLLEDIENMLYGDETQDASLPSPGELLFLFDSFEDLVYDAGSVLTPVFSIHDAGDIDEPVTTTIDSGEV